VWIVFFCDHIFIEPELDVGEVAHVELVDGFFGFVGRSALE
jgi:hypothetical protein